MGAQEEMVCFYYVPVLWKNMKRILYRPHLTECKGAL